MTSKKSALLRSLSNARFTLARSGSPKKVTSGLSTAAQRAQRGTCPERTAAPNALVPSSAAARDCCLQPVQVTVARLPWHATSLLRLTPALNSRPSTF